MDCVTMASMECKATSVPGLDERVRRLQQNYNNAAAWRQLSVHRLSICTLPKTMLAEACSYTISRGLAGRAKQNSREAGRDDQGEVSQHHLQSPRRDGEDRRSGMTLALPASLTAGECGPIAKARAAQPLVATAPTAGGPRVTCSCGR